MKQHFRTFACGSVALAMILGACTDRQTMASKSAEAYREAQAKGAVPGGEGGHGHHSAEASLANAAPDHAAHGVGGAATNTGVDHAAHGATDHAAQAASNERGSPHAAHAAPGASTDHAAMQHGSSAAGHGQQASTSTAMTHEKHSAAQAAGGATQHGAHGATQHGAHGATQHGATQPTPLRVAAPLSSSEMAAVRPDATLQPDDFDAPSRISVAEAAKAGGSESHGAAPAAHRGHGSPPDAQSGTIYTCPMDPEVTSATPGTCPKCGMTLIERKKQ
ncbi:MAG: hypothetical protein M3P06_03695 [Acidobacteriota bacterium]|nr:hypothetical protein [Acidobacteriota bacterium]